MHWNSQVPEPTCFWMLDPIYTMYYRAPIGGRDERRHGLEKRPGCALLELPVSAPPSWTAAPTSGHWVGRGGQVQAPARKGGKDAAMEGNAAN